MKKVTLLKTTFFSLLICALNGKLAAQYDFTANPTSGCYPLTVTFTNLTSDPNAYYYRWYFNDGTPYLQDTLSTTVTHIYQPGNYAAYVEIYDNTWSWLTWTFGSSGQINVQGSTSFSQSADSVCPNETVDFCGDWQASSWLWNFGDATTSTYQCPQHSYAGLGTYNVTLIQTGSCGTDTIIQQIKITNNIPATAGFSFNPNPACPTANVSFYPYVYEGVHLWDFGDGDTSSLSQNIYHSYDSAGNFSVIHIVTNNCALSDTVTKTVTIDSNIYITASVYINFNKNPVCPGDDIYINTNGGYNSYIWSFGDGTPDDTTTAGSLYHTFTDTGDFIVEVRIFNGCGNDTTVKDTMIVNNSVGFDSTAWYNFNINSPQPGCPGDNIAFNAEWGYHNYFFNYGDGNTEARNEQNYSNHVYANVGNYPVSVTFQNNCGIDTALYDTVVITNTAGFNGSVNINIDPDPPIICPGQTVVFQAWGYKKYIWSFGDGTPALTTTYSSIEHVYADTGNYSASITVFNNCNVDTTVSGTITVDDSVGFPNDPSFKINSNTSTACPGAGIDFWAPAGFANYSWDFDDGSPVSSAPVSSYNHTYADTGVYILSVIITNHCGFDTTLSKTITIINNAGFPGSINLWVNPGTACPGEQVNLQTEKGFEFYKWNFGDGNIDSVKNSPYSNHIYAQGGNFLISVKITNFCGLDTTLTDSVTIDTNIRILSYANIYVNSNPACPGQEIGFGTNSNLASYVWNFGDGAPLETNTWSSAQHAFQDTGVYTVSVKVTNYCGNDSTLTALVTIGNNVGFTGNLSLDVNPFPSCPGDQVNLNTSGGYESYFWDFGDSTNAVGSSWADHYYDSIGTYNVFVTIVNQCGIDTTLSAQSVIDSNTAIPFWLQVYSNTSVACPGESVELTVNGGGFSSYQWNFGDGDTATTTGDRISHVYDTLGTYVVSVKVFNGCGKFTTVYTTINVQNNAPLPEMSISVFPTPACPGDEIQIAAGNGSKSYLYIWGYGDGKADTVTGSGVMHAYSDTGTFNISLTAFNTCGDSGVFNASVVIEDSLAPNLDNGEGWGIPNGTNVGGCPGDAILFYFWGTGDNYWDFGDGYSDVATERLAVEDGFVVTIIKHAYSDTGTYKVKLTATNGCGISTTDSMDVIIGNNLLVNGALLIEEPVTAGGYTTCSPIGFLAIGGETYSWNFGDGNTLTTINPTVTHAYTNPGNYSVSVQITNGCGNSVSMSSSLTVFDFGTATVNTNVITNITCMGGNNGSIEATVVGGQPPFTYLWNDLSAQTSSVAVNLTAGTYLVTVTDKVGCAGIGSLTLVNPPDMALSTSSALSVCDSSTGTATVNVTNYGVPPYTYLWSDNSTGQTATGLSFGTYSIIVTDSNGCSNSALQSVSDLGSAAIVVDSTASATCTGAADASAYVTVTGGTPPYTYNWSNGATVQDPQNLTAGNYSLTVSDGSGCKSASFATVTQPLAINLSFTTVGTGCGTSNGSATVDASGGTGSYTYLWDNNTNDQTTQTATGLPYGTFDITVTDANGCSSVGTASVNNTNSPSISAVITDVSCFGGSNGSIIQTVTGGTTPYTYLWNVGGATKNKNNIPAGNYTCFIQDKSGCVTIRNYTVTQPAVLAASASSTVYATCGNADGSVMVGVTGGTTPYSYLWTGGGTSSSVSGLAGGNYNVTVTDSKGCTAGSSASVAVNAAPQQICIVTVDSATKKNLLSWQKTAGLNTSSFVIYKEVSLNVYNAIDTVPYDSTSLYIDYASDPKTKSDRYKVAAIDSCGNTSVQSGAHKTIHLVVNTGINDERNLSLTDGYEGFTFGKYRIWRGTAINNITLIDSIVSNATTYSDWDTLTGVDSLFYITEAVHPQGGCTSTLKLKTYNSSKSNTASLEAPSSQLVSNISVTNTTCNGGNDGTATASVSGGAPPFTYLWSDTGAQTNPAATGLTAGIFYVTITDSEGTTATDTAVVTEPSAVSLSITETQDTCSSGDGTATASASGGNGGYTYSWSSGQSTNNATGLAAGTYSVTAIDASGCTGVNSATINVLNISLAVSFTVADATCNNADGSLTAAASNGTGGYAYMWSNSQSAATATGLAAGTYSVTATDGNGCSGTSSSSVNSVNVLLTLLSTSSAVSCNGLSNGSATVLAASGTSPYSYLWNPAAGSQTNATATGLAAGNYDVTVTDSEGCYNSQNVTVTEPAQITLSVSTVNSSCGNADGSATVAASGGVGGYTYSWSNGQSASAATALTAGNYTITVKDGNNCSQTTMASVSDANAPTLVVSSTDVACNGDGDGTATVTPSGGTPPYTYQWDAGTGNQTDSAATGLSGGSYSISVYDGAGCLATQSAVITEPVAITIAAVITDATSPGNNDGAIDLTVTGGTGAYTFAWSNAEVTEDISGLSAGTYSVTVTDVNNCQLIYIDTVKLIVDAIYRITDTEYRLHAYPNPFKDETTLQFQLSVDSKVSLALFSLLGEKIVVLSEGNQARGIHSYVINSVKSGIKPGIFILKLTVNGFENNLMIIESGR